MSTSSSFLDLDGGDCTVLIGCSTYAAVHFQTFIRRSICGQSRKSRVSCVIFTSRDRTFCLTKICSAPSSQGRPQIRPQCFSGAYHFPSSTVLGALVLSSISISRGVIPLARCLPVCLITHLPSALLFLLARAPSSSFNNPLTDCILCLRLHVCLLVLTPIIPLANGLASRT